MKSSPAWRAAAVLALVMPLSACFAILAVLPPSSPGETAPGTPLPTPSPASTWSVTVPAEALPAEHEPDEPLLGSVSSARGTAEFSIEPSSTGRVAVYIRCAGDGEISVRVGDFAGVTQQCTPGVDPAPTRDVVEHEALSGDQPLAVTAEASDARIWAVAITELPAE